MDYWRLARWIGVYQNRLLADGDLIYVENGALRALALGTTGQALIAQPGATHKLAWGSVSGGTGGGGTTDHAALSNLNLLDSGHTSVADRIWGSDGFGDAALYEIGLDIQAWDPDTEAISNLTGTGFSARTGTSAWALRTFQGPAAGLTITNPAGVAGDPTFALANDLGAVEGITTTGLAVRTATDTWVTRTIVGTTGISVANGGGVAAAPSISIDTSTIKGVVSGATGAVYTDDLPASGVSYITPTQEFQNSQSAGSWTNTFDVGTVGVSSTITARGLEVTIPSGGGSTKIAGIYHSTLPSLAADFAIAARVCVHGGLSATGAGGLAIIQGTGSTDDIYFAGFISTTGANQYSAEVGTLTAYNAAALTGIFASVSGPAPEVYVVMRISTAFHITTYVGATQDTLTLADLDRNLAWNSAARICLLGWGLNRKMRFTFPYVRVIADTYPGATYDFPPRISGSRYFVL